MACIVIAVSFGLAGAIVGKIKGNFFWLWFLISTLVPILGPPIASRARSYAASALTVGA